VAKADTFLASSLAGRKAEEPAHFHFVIQFGLC